MTYTFTCSQGHDPITFTVEATNDEEALAKIMEQTAPHLAEKHQDMPAMSPEEAKNMIMANWQKEPAA